VAEQASNTRATPVSGLAGAPGAFQFDRDALGFAGPGASDFGATPQRGEDPFADAEIRVAHVRAFVCFGKTQRKPPESLRSHGPRQ